ncbi:l-arabinose isomerase [Roseburia sp. CAG:471]|nr:l-arabinose isomerase [Roseburia sp. CAG:471]
MKTTKNYKFWFATGSQDLYGDECLQKVAEHSQIIVNELNKSGILPYEVVWKPTLITNEVIRKTFNEANADEECAGVITSGCIPSPRQNPGSWDCRNTGNRCCICIPSSTKRFHTIPSTWIL